ncbi:flagellin [Pelagicoccus sp. NFK12]|uniref:Flagellin n=1 Tax=Pelagicoccus enzymogenes TaxID=2773457 RepID=A0A927F590_9BACT|nr:flagellin [Pelagicoccus enzymogenes]MBD5778644.1 flagellin [Pelagicoccus enzymogenes]MDQ8196984.1 flagellin [Pelagicoccus enzymogenes]
MVINTNSNAVEAASSLQRSSAMLSKSLARLSSGSKIINPSDDAAGLAVSEKLEAQNARVLAARTNTQNAMSMLHTTDGFLQGMMQTLNRMSELSMMTRDVTKNDSDKALYKQEFEQLKDQLRSVVGANEPDWTIDGEPIGTFNGISLFGDRGDLPTVVGATGDQFMNIPEMNLKDSASYFAQLLTDGNGLSVAGSSTIAHLTATIQEIAENRSEIGSLQSRLEFVDTQLVTQSQNLESANSRIRDVDVAEESTRLAKYQILVQSGTSMLTQANSLPETVLRLLN